MGGIYMVGVGLYLRCCLGYIFGGFVCGGHISRILWYLCQLCNYTLSISISILFTAIL